MNILGGNLYLLPGKTEKCIQILNTEAKMNLLASMWEIKSVYKRASTTFFRILMYRQMTNVDAVTDSCTCCKQVHEFVARTEHGSLMKLECPYNLTSSCHCNCQTDTAVWRVRPCTWVDRALWGFTEARSTLGPLSKRQTANR